MTKKINKGRLTATTIDPADMRSWHKDDHRLKGMKLFKAKLDTPGQEQERLDCIKDGVHARTRFAEWGLFYIEGEKAPADFPVFDPIWGITKIPSTTVFRVYEDHKDRPKRDEQVILILPPPQGTQGEHRDPMWRCTYTPYLQRKKASKEKKGKKRASNK